MNARGQQDVIEMVRRYYRMQDSPIHNAPTRVIPVVLERQNEVLPILLLLAILTLIAL